MKSKILLMAAAVILSACGNFPEKYENVIEDEKIRPFGIALEPAEAAPGDTVHVTLHLYDAGKDYNITWELSLDYSISNYGQLGGEDAVLDLDSMRLDQSDNNLLEFDFVVPAGSRNPLLKSNMIPDIIISSEDLSSQEKAALESFGVTVGPKGVKTADLVQVLDSVPFIPDEMTPYIDGMVSLVAIRAKITSPGFKMDVTKKLSIRYSNKLAGGTYFSNVNENPQFDSIGIITVHKEGVEDPDEMKSCDSDTQWFSVNAHNGPVELGSVVDTFTVKSNKSYFLVADTAGIAQNYRSPDGLVHKEQIFFEWYYTNLDDAGNDWESLIELSGDDKSLPVVSLKIPTNKNMHNFHIRTTALDWRAEWGMLSSTGMGFLEAAGYFKYE